MSATPNPPPRPPSESEVDAVLDKIDRCIPRILKRAEDAKHSGDTPVGGFSPAKIKRTQQAFQAMSKDALLSCSGDDITVKPEDEDTAARGNPRHAPVMKSPAKRALFFRGK